MFTVFAVMGFVTTVFVGFHVRAEDGAFNLSSRFRAVFDPPLLNGMMWSNSRRSREPQSTHWP